MKRNEGITLIALIITIVILIILTAITINSITSTNLFGLAKGAADNYIQAGKDEEKAIDDMVSKTSEIVGGLTGGGTTPTVPEDGKEAYTVELEVDEASVTGEQIPIKVSKVTKTDEVANVARINEVPTGNFTYTYYLETDEGEQEEVTDATGAHTFTELDKTKSYTIKVKAKDEEGNYGETEVKVLSFLISFQYYRCTDGMTWGDWCNSSYTHTFVIGSIYPFAKYDLNEEEKIGYTERDNTHWWVTADDQDDAGILPEDLITSEYCYLLTCDRR